MRPKYTVLAYSRDVFKRGKLEAICDQLVAQFSDQGCEARVVGGGACLAVMPIDRALIRGRSAETLVGLRLIEAVSAAIHPFLVDRKASARIGTADKNYDVTVVFPEREIEGDRWCLMNAAKGLDVAAIDIVLSFRKDVGDGLYEKLKSALVAWCPTKREELGGNLRFGNIDRDRNALRIPIDGEWDAWTWIDFYFWIRSQLNSGERPKEIHFQTRESF